MITLTRHWQPPDAEESVFQYPEMRAALLPVVRVVAASPAATWWVQEFTPDEQVWVGRGKTWDTLSERLKRLGGDTQRKKELSCEPFSGQWWSVPTAGSTPTSREYPLDVTALKQYDWQAVTGLRRPWVMPEWSRVMRPSYSVATSLSRRGCAPLAKRRVQASSLYWAGTPPPSNSRVMAAVWVEWASKSS